MEEKSISSITVRLLMMLTPQPQNSDQQVGGGGGGDKIRLFSESQPNLEGKRDVGY